jgi:hypothetical protein
MRLGIGRQRLSIQATCGKKNRTGHSHYLVQFHIVYICFECVTASHSGNDPCSTFGSRHSIGSAGLSQANSVPPDVGN